MDVKAKRSTSAHEEKRRFFGCFAEKVSEARQRKYIIERNVFL